MTELLQSMTILVDTREQKNAHILQWFEEKHIPYQKKTLHNGDYSFFLPANPSLHLPADCYFDRSIMVERKGSLEELSGNFTENRDRFEKEMLTYHGKKYLMIEGANYSDVLSGNYQTKMAANAFIASLHSFNHKFDVQFIFLPQKESAGCYLYGTFLYYLKTLLTQ